MKDTEKKKLDKMGEEENATENGEKKIWRTAGGNKRGKRRE
jgi:hypothetical protein